MDVQRPIQNQKLRADWGRAVADAVAAGRLEGDGTFRSPVGASLAPVQPPPVPFRPARRPFDVQIGAYKSGNQLVIRFSVVPGKVWYVSGTSVTELAYSATDFTTKGTADGFDGTNWVCGAPASTPGQHYICACLTYSGSSAAPAGWTLRLLAPPSRTGETCLPVAVLTPLSGGGWKIEQLRHGEIFVQAAALPGPDPAGDAVPKNLVGTDYNAATDSWTWGDTDQTTGKPTYPVFNPTRLYWQESAHTLWMFHRTETFNSSGMLVEVSAEVRTAVFVTVAEMP